MRNLIMWSLAVVALLAAANPALAQKKWGNVTGKIVFEGTPPKADKLTVPDALCAKHNLLDESLVVSKEGGVKNVLVALYIAPGGKSPEVHPDYAALVKEKVVMDNVQCRFEPRLAIAVTGQPVVFKNKDEFGHNVKGSPLKNPEFNQTIPAGAELEKIFKTAETVPTSVACTIHPWMSGRLIVRDDPYAAVTKEDGSFEIKNVPAGEWTFRFWQERSGYIEAVKQNDKAATWKLGRVKVEVVDGKGYDFGVIKVGAAEFPAAGK